MELQENSPSITKPGYHRPALIAGALCALFTGIVYVVPLLSCACFVWGIAFGLLASYMMSRAHPAMSALQATGVGALSGLYSGLIVGGVSCIMLLLRGGAGASFRENIPTYLQMYEEMLGSEQVTYEQLEEIRVTLEHWTSSGYITLGIPLVIILGYPLLFALFGTIGGAIGGSIFGKEDGGTEEA